MTGSGGESQVGKLGAGEGESYSEQIFYYPYGIIERNSLNWLFDVS